MNRQEHYSSPEQDEAVGADAAIKLLSTGDGDNAGECGEKCPKVYNQRQAALQADGGHCTGEHHEKSRRGEREPLVLLGSDVAEEIFELLAQIIGS